MNNYTTTSPWMRRATLAIHRDYPLPQREAMLARLATWDLWHGPILPSELDDDDAAQWPGFSDACDELRRWADTTLPSDVWYDDDSDNLSTSEPESWTDDDTGEVIDPFLGSICHLGRKAILAAMFGKLAEYV